VVIRTIPGVIGGNVFSGYGNGRTYWTVQTSDGKILADTGSTPEYMEQSEPFMKALRENFPNVNVLQVENRYSVGETIDDFENYKIIY
jgi:hypothetical protein